MRAAVLRKTSAAFPEVMIEDVEVDKPRSREVLVRTAATGVCHSDLHYIKGDSVMAMPAVLGHEGAGIVEAVGDQVTYVKPGDHVIVCISAFCGHCERCLSGHPHRCVNRFELYRSPDDTPRLTWHGGERLSQHAGISTFAEQMLVHENSLVKIREDMPLDRAALIGCAVTTGLGAVFHTAAVEPGSTVAVFGAGGIGLSVIQGARIAGARMVIAVDVLEHKLATAKQFGATHVVDASSRDAVQAIRDMTGGGVDYSFEAIGLKQTYLQAFDSITVDGTATIIGLMPVGEKLEVEGRMFLRGRFQGSMMGSNRFRIDMPRYIDFYMQGRLNLDDMVTRRAPLDGVNEAFRAMEAGEVVRTVLTFD
ncbi:MAG TPA: Zn-dependent alcohol dehydrogenase [Dehalococcoidia bacterium]|nr:Zn-dependent alcohol dehydrogenase [Dehalococcoidia bacterium]